MSKFVEGARSLFVAALVAAAGCGGDWSSPEEMAGGSTTAAESSRERVLFVGNSLTEGNELPFLVEALSQAGGRPLAVDAVTYGGVSLEDHWRLATQDRIASGAYRYVVLQQGPSALPESRANLREWTRRFDEVIRKAGGRSALYMVWPESYRRHAFGDVSASYRLASEDVGGVLLPAGDAWLAAWKKDESLRLYGSDGFHPTLLGSYLAAVVIYGALTEAPTTGLPAELRLRSGRTVAVPARDAAKVQEAAAEVLGAS
jgi:hypothetical protein